MFAARICWPILSILFLVAAPASAVTDTIDESRIVTLGGGEYLWDAERAPAGPVEIVVVLPTQRALVYRGGHLIGASSISSGRSGYESPIGRFQILEKKRMHRSNRYDDAPMPYMQRLNWHGIAFHGGHVTGRPASHGCIRLPIAFARLLFAETEVGTYVFVTEERPDSPTAALALARRQREAFTPMKPDRTFEGAPGAL